MGLIQPVGYQVLLRKTTEKLISRICLENILNKITSYHNSSSIFLIHVLMLHHSVSHNYADSKFFDGYINVFPNVTFFLIWETKRISLINWTVLGQSASINETCVKACPWDRNDYNNRVGHVEFLFHESWCCSHVMSVCVAWWVSPFLRWAGEWVEFVGGKLRGRVSRWRQRKVTR